MQTPDVKSSTVSISAQEQLKLGDAAHPSHWRCPQCPGYRLNARSDPTCGTCGALQPGTKALQPGTKALQPGTKALQPSSDDLHSAAAAQPAEQPAEQQAAPASGSPGATEKLAAKLAADRVLLSNQMDGIQQELDEAVSNATKP